MDHIKGFLLDLEKVSRDFAKLTPPEFSSNIVLRFIHYNVSSPFPITRGVARNTDLGGPGCNRNIPNIIFKSIGYKIINFHILLYT